MSKPTAREWAMIILHEWEEKDAYSNLILNHYLQKSDLQGKDRGLVTELVYGTITHLNTIDYCVSKLVKDRESLEPWVVNLLRIGVYQLSFLDRIPERAAVYETVEVAKRRGHQGIAKLVNGVLRAFLRQKKELIPTDPPKKMKLKTLYYSHPKWMIKRLEEVYGEEVAHLVLVAQNQPPKITARVNRLQVSRNQLIEEWNKDHESRVEPSFMSEDGLIFHRSGNLAHTPEFQTGKFTIQDESSMLVAFALHPESGMKVLDTCAAPGGKTTHLAEIMENQGSILACDLHPHKIDLIQEQADRLDLSMIEAKAIDARQLPNELGENSFDAILLDAPCSGYGVIRRKPDIKWRKEGDPESLATLQRELLDAVAKLLKPGGALVYSTCTWEPRENMEQIQSFMKRHPEFTIDQQWMDRLPAIIKEEAMIEQGTLQILPHHFGTDGFFISRLVKRN